MTVRELRQMLFNVDNQEMTVRELRALLFDVAEQDKELTDVAMTLLSRNHKKED